MDSYRRQHIRRFNNKQQPHRDFARPSPHALYPFMDPQIHVPIAPFGNNFMYPGEASIGMVPIVTFVQGPPADTLGSLSLVPDPDLREKIVKQIEYYFSDENLVKDTFLRQRMEKQGWVPVTLIAGFKKVSCLTNNVQLILDVMQTSTTVEVQGEKMRKRIGWMRWPIPTSLNEENYSRGSASVANCNKVDVDVDLKGLPTWLASMMMQDMSLNFLNMMQDM